MIGNFGSKKPGNKLIFTAEPGNICGVNSFKYSGLANKQVVALDPVKDGKKESIVLTTKSAKVSRTLRPKSMLVKTTLKKQTAKGLAALEKVMIAGRVRRDLAELTKAKYAKIRTSFRARKGAVKSRRA